MNEKVTIPADLRAKLTGGAAQLCDESGNLVGYYLSLDRMETLEAERKAMYEWANHLVTEGELDRAEGAGGAHTMEEVFKLLERK